MPTLELHRLWMQGRKLSAAAASALEASLVANPDDVHARIQLTGYYGMHSKEPASECTAQSLWFIEHHPELDLWPITLIDETVSPQAYEVACRLWRTALEQQPRNPAVIEAASAFFSLSDRAFARKLLRIGAALEPARAHWHRALGTLCMTHARFTAGTQRIEVAREAIESFERAHDLEATDQARYALLIEIADAAVLAGDHARATACAERLRTDTAALDGTDLQLRGRHRAHIVLGHVAIARNEVKLAAEHLLASVDDVASLSALGPDQELASELFARGERDAVLAYADTCRRAGASLGLLGQLFRSPTGEPPALRIVT